MISFALSLVLLLIPAAVTSGQGDKEKAATRESELTKKAEALVQEAIIASGTSDQRLAQARLLDALHIWIEIGEPDKAAHSALLVGDSYRRMNRFREALYDYNQALEVKALSSQVKAIAFNSIARLYEEIYHLELAKLYYRKAADQAQDAKDIASQAEALSGLATIYYHSGEREQALACIGQVQRLNQQQGDDGLEARLLLLTGQITQEQGLAERSREALNAALATYKRMRDAEGQGKVLCSVSALDLSLGQNQSALDSAQQAVDLAATLIKQAVSGADRQRVWNWQWRAWLALARAQRAMGQKEKAVKSYFHALIAIEGVWLSTTSTTNVGAVAFGEERQAPYRELVEVLIEQERLNDAYNIVEQARARTLLSLIETRRTAGTHQGAGQDEILRGLARHIANQRTQLLSSTIGPKQRAKIEREIEASESALAEAHAQAEMGRRPAWFRPASVERVQKQLSPDKGCVLEFFLGERRSFVWFIASDDVSFEILPARQQIEKAVEDYLTVINTKPNNLYLERRLAVQREMAEKLGGQLFGRLADRLAAGQPLTIVPDGILNYLPFETLRHGGQYLVEDHVINYLPSAGLLELLRDSPGQADAGDKLDLLAFGDPIFSPKQARPKHESDGIDATRQALNATDGFQLDALPRTRDEVEGIAKLFAPDRRRIFLGQESTEDALKAAPLRRYRRLHFATHSLINESDPSRSAIVLTQDIDPQEDGFLEVGEIAELDLDCDLVVLSACQTGRGKLFSGEGIVGLSRAFLYAGARSLVVSLWNVSDISTSRLMKNFYQHLISNMGNAAALRQAKLQMLRSGNETRHPYYWAPFIVVGKP